jgi:hypothetical protein
MASKQKRVHQSPVPTPQDFLLHPVIDHDSEAVNLYMLEATPTNFVGSLTPDAALKMAYALMAHAKRVQRIKQLHA